jgi:hypothetical protein
MTATRKILFVLLLTTIASALPGQDWNAIFNYEMEASYAMADRQFEKAADFFLKALKKFPESDNLKFKVGYCYLKTDDKKGEALPYLEEAAKNINPNYKESSLKEPQAPPEALFNLANAYLHANRFTDAADAFRKYKEYLKPSDNLALYVEQAIKSCGVAQSFIDNPIGLKATNLGVPINSDLPNFNPVVSGDGNTLAYTTQTRTGNKIFVASKADNGWSAPKEITKQLGDNYLKTSCLSYDGKELYLITDDPSNADIVVSFLEKGKWGKPIKFGKPINSKSNENHICVSNDGNTVYFSSDRKGGQGGFDIYKSSVVDDRWSEPVNLGSSINTKFNDDTPFLTPDEKYLFFSSEGHNSMGGFDIFFVNLSGTPQVVNVGYPLNTPENNLFFQPTGRNTGYYAFYQGDGQGQRDIYQIAITPLIELKGSVQLAENADNSKQYVATITNQETRTLVATITGSATDMFSKKLTPGSYEVTVTSDKYNPFAQIVDIPADYSGTDFPVNALLTPIPVVVEQPLAELQKPEKTDIPSKTEEPTRALEQPPVVEEKIIVEPKKEEPKKEEPKKLEPMKEQPKRPVEVKKKEPTKKSVEKPKPEARKVEIKPAPAEKKEVRRVAPQPVPTLSSNIISSYSVQLMALRNPMSVHKFANLDSIDINYSPDGFYRYTVGRLTSVEKAEEVLARVKSLGYSSAFVRINRSNQFFTIQLVALKKPVEATYFKDIQDISISKGADGFYRYSCGLFIDYAQAQDELKRLAEMGYTGAFIKKVIR